jgi:hypothetical protein
VARDPGQWHHGFPKHHNDKRRSRKEIAMPDDKTKTGG